MQFRMAPLAYIFIRLLPQSTNNNDGTSYNRGEDKLLVQESSPTFSNEEYNTLIGIHNEKNELISPLKRLFSFPMTDSNGDDNNTMIYTDVFESTLFINEEEPVIIDKTHTIISTNELLQLVVDKESPYTHMLNLYRQQRLDARVPGRRLLHGSSGSNFDEYTLRSKPRVIFFDCDDCLYFDNWEIAKHLSEKIEEHCQSEYNLPKGYAYTLYKQHGTALRGLLAEGHLERDSKSIDKFLQTVHDIPIHTLLKPDPQLRDILMKINPSIRKFVFTASVSHHAQRCLEALGIADVFDGIIDVNDCKLETKHSLSSFQAAMEKAGIKDPEGCIFLDDSLKNIETARSVGWRSGKYRLFVHDMICFVLFY